jgi:signal transduction histidine kinase
VKQSSTLEDDRQEWVVRHSLDLLYGNLISGAVGGLILISILAGIIHESANKPMLWTWLIAGYGISFTRMVYIYFYKTNKDWASLSWWLSRYRLMSLLSGAHYAAASIFLFPQMSPYHQIAIAIMVAGIVAGAVAIHSVDIISFLLFSLPATLALAARLFLVGESATTGVGAMVLLFLPAMLKSAFEHRNIILKNFELSYTLHENALRDAVAYQELEKTLTTLRDTQGQLVQQGKMASLGTLIAGIAHEINNPINFAHAGAQTLGRDLEHFRKFLLELAADDAGDAVLDSLNRHISGLMMQIDTIVEGTTRIKRVVWELLTFSRMDQTDKRAVRIIDNLRSTANLVRTHYADVVEIRYQFMADPEIECWPGLLNQVFMNVILNACHAIKKKQNDAGNRVSGTLEIRSRLADDFLVIEFEDNGCGIRASIIERIFEPFFTTKSVGEGTGLGLSISFGIMEKHRGSITVRSQEDENTCFILSLPIKPAAL